MIRVTAKLIILIVLLGALGKPSTASDRTANAGLELQPMDRAAVTDLATTPAITQSTRLSARITGPIVNLTVEQTFTNPTDIFMEGLYRFPLPDDASVHAMEIRIGDRVILGQVKEKAEAKRTYLRAVKEGRRASLLREHRPNVFSNLIGNIAPGESLKVRIELVSLARFDGALFRWVLPQAITPRYAGPQGELAYQSEFSEALFLESMDFYSEEAQSTVGFDASFGAADWLSGAYINGTAIQLHKAETGLQLVHTAPTDQDMTLTWEPVLAADPGMISFTESIDGEDYTLALLLPPQPSTSAITPPRDLVFVLDTSGSMHGPSIRQAKEGLKAALAKLRPEDRFDVIEFNSYHKALYGQLQPATPQFLNGAIRFIDQLDADGGTVMAPALASALNSYGIDHQRLQQLVFLTDGAVSEEAALFQMVADNLGSKKLFTVGVGPAPNSWFMRKAAEFGRGTYEIIADHEQVGARIESLLDAMARPRLTDISLTNGADLSPADTNAIYPKRLPDLYGGNAQMMVLHDNVSADRSLVVSGNRADGGAWTAFIPPQRVEEGTGIAKIWARKRIEHLIDEQAMGADRDKIKAQIVETSLTHQILSPHTSFIAVDTTPVRPAEDPLGRNLIKSKGPMGLVASKDVGHQLAATRFAAPQGGLGLTGQVLMGMLALLAALFLVAGARGLPKLRQLSCVEKDL